VLDATFTLYRRNFALIASISAWCRSPTPAHLAALRADRVATFVRSPCLLGGQSITQAQAQQLLNSYVGILVVTLGCCCSVF